MNEGMITEVVDALTAKNRTVKGWEGKVSLCDLGYCMASTHWKRITLLYPKYILENWILDQDGDHRVVWVGLLINTVALYCPPYADARSIWWRHRIPQAGIDEGWEGCGEGVNNTQHYLNGTPAVASTFPDMKGLVQYGHSKGLKMGWYFNGCGCIEKREPATGWGVNYEGDIKMLAEFGFDSVKFDGCGRMCNMTMYADLMNKTGKSFEIENCHW